MTINCFLQLIPPPPPKKTLGLENKMMGAFSLGCGNLAPKLDLLGDVIDKVGQRTVEPLIVFHMETGMLVLSEIFF